MAHAKFIGTISEVEEVVIDKRNLIGVEVKVAHNAKLRFIWHSPVRQKLLATGSTVLIQYVPVKLHLPKSDLNIPLPDQIPRRFNATIVNHEQLRSGLSGAADIGLDRDIITIDCSIQREACLFDRTPGIIPQRGDAAEIEMELTAFFGKDDKPKIEGKTFNDEWTTPKMRYEIADAYKEKFIKLTERVGMVQEHTFVSAFPFIKGHDLLSCKRLPNYHEIRQNLCDYSQIKKAQRYFVSHRWLQKNHPDPDGRQLELLKKDVKAEAFYWIDYSCLPQKPRTDIDDVLFWKSIRLLPSLMFGMNFIVLRCLNDRYFERAWCFFELLAANVIGAQLSYISESEESGTEVTTEENDRAMLELTLIKGELPSNLGVTETVDLEAIQDAAKTVTMFFKLRLIEHYLTLGQMISDQKLFFAEDPYYFMATCDLSDIILWVFNKARELGMRLIDLSQESYSDNFFMKMAAKEDFRHMTNPHTLPRKITLDESRLGWLIVNKHRLDSPANLFYLMTSMIR